MRDIPDGDGRTERSAYAVLIVSAGLAAAILVNAYIIWYFLAGLPSECAARAIASAGRETCSTGPAVPMVIVISAALIAVSLFLLYRWNVQKKGP